MIERFRSQIDFIAHFADDAVTRFARYRRAAVLIVGDGDTSRAIAAGLLRNGSQTVEIRRPGPSTPAVAVDTPDGQVLYSTGPIAGGRHDMVVICADEVGPATVWRACANLAPDGPAVLPVLTLGRQAMLGPVTRHGASPCWGCLLLRLQANAEAGDLARMWQAIATAPGDGDGHRSGQRLPSASVAQIVGSAAAFDVFRLLTEALIGESAGAVLVQDVDTLESTRERLLPHPECGWCHGDGPPAAAGPAPEDLVERADGGPMSEEEIHERQLTLVRKHVGIVTAFTDHGLTQSPLKVARCRLGVRTRRWSPGSLPRSAWTRCSGLGRRCCSWRRRRTWTGWPTCALPCRATGFPRSCGRTRRGCGSRRVWRCPPTRPARTCRRPTCAPATRTGCRRRPSTRPGRSTPPPPSSRPAPAAVPA
ncbi:TOMM precursor leader peptide-binding protein [Catellatospora coxensis]